MIINRGLFYFYFDFGNNYFDEFQFNAGIFLFNQFSRNFLIRVPSIIILKPLKWLILRYFVISSNLQICKYFIVHFLHKLWIIVSWVSFVRCKLTNSHLQIYGATLECFDVCRLVHGWITRGNINRFQITFDHHLLAVFYWFFVLLLPRLFMIIFIRLVRCLFCWLRNTRKNYAFFVQFIMCMVLLLDRDGAGVFRFRPYRDKITLRFDLKPRFHFVVARAAIRGTGQLTILFSFWRCTSFCTSAWTFFSIDNFYNFSSGDRMLAGILWHNWR